jgi:hypothetical protein
MTNPAGRAGFIVVTTTGTEVTSRVSQSAAKPRYRDKICAECGAPFTPSSGRQRFCELHRADKFVTRRNSETRQRRRAELELTAEDATRPPGKLAVFGPHRRRDRVQWVAAALRLARRLHRDHRLGLSQEVVRWATRTALGEVELVGCHHLASLVDHVEFALYGPHVSPFAPPGRLHPGSKLGHGEKDVSAGHSVVDQSEMSDSTPPWVVE